MKLLDQIQELWGRTLSPIETCSIISMIEEEKMDENVIIECAKLSADKERPFQYMKKVLYNIKHPLEKKKEELVEEEIKEAYPTEIKCWYDAWKISVSDEAPKHLKEQAKAYLEGK